MLKYKRILLKLSGEALAGKEKFGFSPEVLDAFCDEIIEIVNMGVEVAIVVGGGNFFRGIKGVQKGFDRVKGDYIGMLATTMNAIAIQSTLEGKGLKAKTLTATSMEPFGERYTPRRAMESLDKKQVIVFAGGTGNPFFTTDSASALRAVEINADVLLKGTRVDGVYTADPEKDPTATKYPKITYDEAIDKKLGVMDLTAFAMCSENKMPIVVFDMNKAGNLKRIVSGEEIGTLVSE